MQSLYSIDWLVGVEEANNFTLPAAGCGQGKEKEDEDLEGECQEEG